MSEPVVFCGHCLATRLTLVEVPSPTSSAPAAVSLQCRCGGYTVHYTSLIEALRAWDGQRRAQLLDEHAERMRHRAAELAARGEDDGC